MRKVTQRMKKQARRPDNLQSLHLDLSVTVKTPMQISYEDRAQLGEEIRESIMKVLRKADSRIVTANWQSWGWQ